MDEDLPENIVEAIEHFQKRAEKAIALEELLNISELLSKIDIHDLPALEERVKKYIQIAHARYESGDISEHELLFHKCFAMENQVHESRWLNGVYDDDLNPISEKMREVEKKYGLTEDQYWPISEAPDEYLELSREYDTVMESKLLNTFSEFNADDLKALYLNNREKFDELHYIGGKSVFLKDERGRLLFLANTYEKEAEAASNGGAFFAAAVT